MPTIRLKIDVSGTKGDEAWRNLRHFDQIQSASFGPRFGSGRVAPDAGPLRGPGPGACSHPAEVVHPKGEWIGAEIRLQTPLLAQYAVSHYLKQERVLDVDVVD